MGCSSTFSKQLCHRFQMGMEAAIFNGIDLQARQIMGRSVAQGNAIGGSCLPARPVVVLEARRSRGQAALLGRLPQGREHVEIAGGPVHPINPIKAKIKLLTKGAVATRTTALGNPEDLRRIDRALEELEGVENIQITDNRLAYNHRYNYANQYLNQQSQRLSRQMRFQHNAITCSRTPRSDIPVMQYLQYVRHLNKKSSRKRCIALHKTAKQCRAIGIHPPGLFRLGALEVVAEPSLDTKTVERVVGGNPTRQPPVDAFRKQL